MTGREEQGKKTYLPGREVAQTLHRSGLLGPAAALRSMFTSWREYAKAARAEAVRQEHIKRVALAFVGRVDSVRADLADCCTRVRRFSCCTTSSSSL